MSKIQLKSNLFKKIVKNPVENQIDVLKDVKNPIKNAIDIFKNVKKPIENPIDSKKLSKIQLKIQLISKNRLKIQLKIQLNQNLHIAHPYLLKLGPMEREDFLCVNVKKHEL